MADEIKTIEENKVKNAGRVAWGKKLAKMSKELKEAKKNGDKEIKLIKKDIKIDKDTENKLSSHHIEVMIGIGGLLVAVVTLYLQYKKVQQPQAPPQAPPQVQLINPYPYNYNNF
jgi:hypothetical protein